MKPSRRDVLVAGAGMAVGAILTNFADRGKRPADPLSRSAGPAGTVDRTGDEYVWLSANSRLPLFVAHDHPALLQAGRELGVRVTIAGPDTVDIPGLVAAVEQTAARRPTGMMVVGWDPSALIPAIDRAVESGIPVDLRRRRRPGEQAAGVHRNRLARPGRAPGAGHGSGPPGPHRNGRDAWADRAIDRPGSVRRVSLGGRACRAECARAIPG